MLEKSKLREKTRPSSCSRSAAKSSTNLKFEDKPGEQVFFSLETQQHPLGLLSGKENLKDYTWTSRNQMIFPVAWVLVSVDSEPYKQWKWKSLSQVWLFVIPVNSPGQNTGRGSLSLLQGIFPTQGLNPGLPPCGQILYQLRHKGSPEYWSG